jgi:DNA-binding response OmpR family regulator
MIDSNPHDRPARSSGSESGRRVLLAEDDGEMRSVLASALRKNDYEVIEAADGKALIDRLSDEMIAGRRVDFVVTDVRMPKLSGLQALKLIKDSEFPMPVIVITAFSDHATQVDAWLFGAAAVLDKPFEIEELLAVIRKLGREPDRSGV